MTDTPTLEATSGAEQGSAPARRSGALSAMKVAELQGLASSLGITGTGKMRKSDLIDAIKARQSGTSSASATGGARRARVDAASAPSDGPTRSQGDDEAARGNRSHTRGGEGARREQNDD